MSKNAVIVEDNNGNVQVNENGTVQVEATEGFTYEEAEQVLNEDGYELTAGYSNEEGGLYVFMKDE